MANPGIWVSKTVISFENLARILPTGLESKNRILDLATLVRHESCKVSEAFEKILMIIWALVSDISMKKMTEPPNIAGYADFYCSSNF